MKVCPRGLWTKGFRRYLHIVKNWSGNFSLNSSRVRALGWPLLGIFSGFVWFFLGGSVGQIIYREYRVFRGSNISCSLAWSDCFSERNLAPHWERWTGPSRWVRLLNVWTTKLEEWLDLAPDSVHETGFSFLWATLLCLVKVPEVLKVESHSSLT